MATLLRKVANPPINPRFNEGTSTTNQKIVKIRASFFRTPLLVAGGGVGGLVGLIFTSSFFGTALIPLATGGMGGLIIGVTIELVYGIACKVLTSNKSGHHSVQSALTDKSNNISKKKEKVSNNVKLKIQNNQENPETGISDSVSQVNEIPPPKIEDTQQELLNPFIDSSWNTLSGTLAVNPHSSFSDGLNSSRPFDIKRVMLKSQYPFALHYWKKTPPFVFIMCSFLSFTKNPVSDFYEPFDPGIFCYLNARLLIGYSDVDDLRNMLTNENFDPLISQLRIWHDEYTSELPEPLKQILTTIQTNVELLNKFSKIVVAAYGYDQFTDEVTDQFTVNDYEELKKLFDSLKDCFTKNEDLVENNRDFKKIRHLTLVSSELFDFIPEYRFSLKNPRTA